MIKVLFVCMGNICRSPTAEGVFCKVLEDQNLGDFVQVDSAGTHAYHIGEPPDPRAQTAALKRGVDLADIRARAALSQDFEEFDYVLAMDWQNYRHLESICPTGQEHKLELFLRFAPDEETNEVPDPYYGGAKGFDRVLDLIEQAANGLVEDIRKRI